MIDTPNQRFVIHNASPVFSTEHLAQVPLNRSRASAPDPPRLGDVGQVVWDTWPMVGDAVINDERGLMMIVEKLPWANTLEVTRGIEEALAALKPGLPGIEIDSTIFRPATFIEMSMTQPDASRCIVGCAAGGHHSRRLPLRMAGGADQR